MSKFCHYHMILMFWQVSTMMWLKLVETSFKAWLQIQGVTISLLMGILFFIVCFHQIYLITFWHLWINCSCGTLLWYTLNLKHFGTFKSIEKNIKMGLWCYFVCWNELLPKFLFTLSNNGNPILVIVTNCDKSFLKFHLWHSN